MTSIEYTTQKQAEPSWMPKSFPLRCVSFTLSSASAPIRMVPRNLVAQPSSRGSLNAGPKSVAKNALRHKVSAAMIMLLEVSEKLSRGHEVSQINLKPFVSCLHLYHTGMGRGCWRNPPHPCTPQTSRVSSQLMRFFSSQQP